MFWRLSISTWTCYKNPDKPTCIDFILANSPIRFHKSDCLFTGLSDYLKLVLPIFKTTFSKSKPKETIYRNFKKFNEEDFNQELRGRLSTELVDNYSSFENVFIDVLNRYTPIKKKVIREGIKESYNEKIPVRENIL